MMSANFVISFFRMDMKFVLLVMKRLESCQKLILKGTVC